jgi:hypothetical protein
MTRHDPRPVAHGIVDDDIHEPNGIHFLVVEALGDQIPVAMHRLGCGARPGLVSLRPSLQGQLRIDVQPDPEVPVVDSLTAETAKRQ